MSRLSQIIGGGKAVIQLHAGSISLIGVVATVSLAESLL